MEEIWKIWEEYPDYKISNLGKIYSFKLKRFLKISLNPSGYKSVYLRNSKGKILFLHHRIIAFVFVENPNNYKEVNHINSNRSDNRAENLEWCSRSYNVKYGFTNNGRIGNNKGSEGIKNRANKAILQYNLQGNFIKEWYSAQEIKNALGYSVSNISQCCNGNYAQAYGFIWKFEKDVII